MFLIKLLNGLFFTGKGAGCNNKDQAAMFSCKESATKYAKDYGGKVVEKKRKK
jgi:hypothetical protein